VPAGPPPRRPAPSVLCWKCCGDCGELLVKPWVKWLALAVFLTAIGVIQFIPA
jgi:hypothetical protein